VFFLQINKIKHAGEYRFHALKQSSVQPTVSYLCKSKLETILRSSTTTLSLRKPFCKAQKENMWYSTKTQISTIGLFSPPPKNSFLVCSWRYAVYLLFLGFAYQPELTQQDPTPGKSMNKRCVVNST